MPGYSVSFPEVGGGSAVLAGAAGELRTELRGLASAVEGLLGTEWRGRAASAFAAEWDVWRAAALDVVDVLADLGVLVGASGLDYEVTDTAVRRAAS